MAIRDFVDAINEFASYDTWYASVCNSKSDSTRIKPQPIKSDTAFVLLCACCTCLIFVCFFSLTMLFLNVVMLDVMIKNLFIVEKAY